MNGTVLPSLGRLGAALQQSQQVTRQIVQVLRAAEEEASQPFRGAGEGGENAQDGGGFWGGVGDFFRGAGAELKDMATGLWTMVTDPVGTAKGLWYGITHPGELWDAIKQPYVEAWESGHPWEAIGRGAVFIGTLLLGTKGADKAAKIGEAAEVTAKAGEVGGVVVRVGEAGALTSKLAEASRLGEVAAVADEIGAVSKAAEVAELAQLLARDARLAESLLSGAEVSDIALATDAFKSATSGLTSPQAAATIERFTNVTDAAIPDIINAYGGKLGQAGDIPAELVGRRITTLGRNWDTLAAETGERILKVPDVPAPLRVTGGPTTTWTTDLNALWLHEAIDNGDVIKLATEVTSTKGSLLGAKEFGGISVYSRELNELLVAGYRRVGDYLIPPQ